ncbi:MAG: peptidoglycan DD-metalloendopeptidase family protein [Succinivibrio sp.]
MINIKITNRTSSEDFIAVERETGEFALPGKHVFGIFSVSVISILLALPFGQLIPEHASPFTALTAGRQEQNKIYEQAYLKNDEIAAEKNLEISSNAGSEENYDDEVIPQDLLKNDSSRYESYSSQPPYIYQSAGVTREKFESAEKKETTSTSKEYVANILEPSKIPMVSGEPQKKENKYDGTWYEQTVRKGDSLFKIFAYLNLDKNDLKQINKVAGRDDLNLSIGDKIQFLVNKDNQLQEIAIPVAGNRQVRFSRDLETGTFAVTKEELFAQFENNIKTGIQKATDMPGYIEAQKERAEQALLAKKLQTQKELEEKERVKEEEKRLAALNRPRLILGSIGSRESFDKAARRLGLTHSEILSIKNQYAGKVNFKRLKEGDSIRVLFNGIGVGASMTAISLNSKQYGEITLYRHPENHLFYEENGYNPSTGNFRRFPIMGQVKVNSPFNLNRFHPIKKKIKPHYGVDFKLNIGTPIYAPSDGVVTYAGYMRGGGYTIIINHKSGYTTVYMHLSKLDVKKDQTVHIGQMIAKSGNTGYSTGPHLHYEIHVNGRAVDPLKVDLPSGSPATAKRLRESFKNNVFILKSELNQTALAENR